MDLITAPLPRPLSLISKLTKRKKTATYLFPIQSVLYMVGGGWLVLPITIQYIDQSLMGFLLPSYGQ